MYLDFIIHNNSFITTVHENTDKIFADLWESCHNIYDGKYYEHYEI